MPRTVRVPRLSTTAPANVEQLSQQIAVVKHRAYHLDVMILCAVGIGACWNDDPDADHFGESSADPNCSSSIPRDLRACGSERSYRRERRGGGERRLL